LWSEDPRIVSQALRNIINLTNAEADKKYDNGNENSKKILSLAGHQMILAALKKHILDKKIVANALVALQNLVIDGSDAYPDTQFSTILDALRSAGAIEVVLKAMEMVKEGLLEDPVEASLSLLKFLIGDSRDHALVVKNTQVKDNNLCGLGLIAQCMKDFPVECTCDLSMSCSNVNKKNRVHYYAMTLLKSISQHEELREYVIASGCLEQIMICLQKIGTRGDKKTRLEWDTVDIMGILYGYKVFTSGRKFEKTCSP
jgi:hypothetical protein